MQEQALAAEDLLARTELTEHQLYLGLCRLRAEDLDLQAVETASQARAFPRLLVLISAVTEGQALLPQLALLLQTTLYTTAVRAGQLEPDLLLDLAAAEAVGLAIKVTEEQEALGETEDSLQLPEESEPRTEQAAEAVVVVLPTEVSRRRVLAEQELAGTCQFSTGGLPNGS